MSYTSLITTGERVCVVHHKNSPYQVTVHFKECVFARRSWTQPYIPEEWPPNMAKYNLIACNHCKPNVN
jgi:hypothetical protein